MSERFRIITVLGFLVLAAFSGYMLTKLEFTFDFEQFFPEGDEDLAFFPGIHRRIRNR